MSFFSCVFSTTPQIAAGREAVARPHTEPPEAATGIAACTQTRYKYGEFGQQIRRVWSANTASLVGKYGEFGRQIRRVYFTIRHETRSAQVSTGSIKSMYHFALQASHYDTDFPISPFAGPFPGCLQPLAGILPAVFPGVAHYACKKTTANLPGQPTTISSGSNDRFGFICVLVLSVHKLNRRCRSVFVCGGCHEEAACERERRRRAGCE